MRHPDRWLPLSMAPLQERSANPNLREADWNLPAGPGLNRIHLSPYPERARSGSWNVLLVRFCTVGPPARRPSVFSLSRTVLLGELVDQRQDSATFRKRHLNNSLGNGKLYTEQEFREQCRLDLAGCGSKATVYAE